MDAVETKVTVRVNVDCDEVDRHGARTVTFMMRDTEDVRTQVNALHHAILQALKEATLELAAPR